MIWPLPNFTGPLRRHPLLWLLALLLLLPAATVVTLYLWMQYHRDAALQALERYAFEEAQHHLDLCLKVPWGNADLQLLAAQTARRRDAYDEAEQHLAECIRLVGVNPTATLERLLLLAQQGEFDGIEGILRARTGADNPDNVMVLEALAKGYANRFWDSNTLVCLNLLLERQPRHPHALLLRARTWENRARKGETAREQDALHDYEKAVELNPSFEAQLGLAGALYRVGRPWDALLIYERLRPLQPANPSLLLGLACCQYSLNEVEEARHRLEELLEQNPHNAEALLERGRLALHAGQDDAEKWLRQAAAASPYYKSEAQHLLYRCLEAAGKTAEARACLEEAHTRDAKVLEVERLMAQANREPRDVELRYQVAKELFRLGREQDGVAALFFILVQQPKHGPVHEALAKYFERTGQPGRASRHRQATVSGPRPSALSR